MPYRPGDFDAARLPDILRLERVLWGPNDEANASYFDWKYLQNPFIANPRIYLVYHRDEVVGVRGFHGTAWRTCTGSEPLVMPAGGDTVIAPAHRSRGLFEKLNRYAVSQLRAEGFEVLCSFSAGPAVYLRSIRAGWRALGSYQWLQWRRDGPVPVPITNTRFGGIAIEPDARVAEMASVIRNCEPATVIRLHRDPVFLKWRYRNPLSRYHFLYAGENELDGYMVIQERLHKRQEDMRIVDWECRDIRVFESLLNAALNEIDSDYFTIWSATLSEDVRAYLYRTGFKPLDVSCVSRRYRPGPLLMATGGEGRDDWRGGDAMLTNLDRWRLRMICSDGC